LPGLSGSNFPIGSVLVSGATGRAESVDRRIASGFRWPATISPGSAAAPILVRDLRRPGCEPLSFDYLTL
jgi:hypothetical protein